MSETIQTTVVGTYAVLEWLTAVSDRKALLDAWRRGGSGEEGEG